MIDTISMNTKTNYSSKQQQQQYPRKPIECYQGNCNNCALLNYPCPILELLNKKESNNHHE